MAEEVADKDGVTGPRDETAGSVPEPMQSHRSESSCETAAAVAAPESGRVEAPPEPIAQDVVLGLREFGAVSKPSESGDSWDGEGHIPVTAPFGQRFFPGRQSAPDEQQTILQVDVTPTQGEDLAETKARVEQQTEGFSIAMILELAGRLLDWVHRGPASSVFSPFANPGERFDLLDLVIVESRGRIFSPFVRTADRIRREAVGIATTGVGKYRCQYLAVLVHVAWLEPLRIQAPEEAGYVCSRHLRVRTTV